ncbi:surface lipoprotein assembly modifier [Shinella zoogloeoides]
MKYTSTISALLLTCVAANAFAATQAEVDVEFKRAMFEASKGHSASAIKRLNHLKNQTNAPRIRLELARLLMRSGAYSEALDIFRQIYLEPETPQIVKRNILPFIEEAELRVLRIRYGARMATDSNPSKVGEGGTVYFNGIPLEYQPPAQKKVSYGIEPWFSAEKLWNNGYLTKFNASARLFKEDTLRSGTVQVAVAKQVPAVPGLFVQAALESEVVKDGSYVLPNVESWKRFRLSDRAGVGLGGQVGYMFSENKDVSGPFYRGYVFGDWTFSPNATVFSRLSAETLDSRNDFYHYFSTKAEVGFNIDIASVQLVPKISWKQTRFTQTNPLWGVKRKDVTVRPELTLSSEVVEWNGIRPEVSVFYEWRESNIDIYKYDQIGGYVNFKKLF